jgi:hypothetical protein
MANTSKSDKEAHAKQRPAVEAFVSAERVRIEELVREIVVAGSEARKAAVAAGIRDAEVSVGKAWLWSGLLAFVILEMAIVAGWVAATGTHVGESWKSVLVALAGAALGFGAAILFIGHFTNSRGRELELDYEAIRARAGKLLAEVDRLEKGVAVPKPDISSDRAS